MAKTTTNTTTTIIIIMLMMVCAMCYSKHYAKGKAKQSEAL